MVQACLERFGRIDILHNNVGIGTGDSSITACPRKLGSHLRGEPEIGGVRLQARAAVDAGATQRRDHQHLVAGSRDAPAYQTSKAALNALTQSLAIGNARFNIRANVIMPGLMNTPMAIEGYVARGEDREQLIAERNAQVPLDGMVWARPETWRTPRCSWRATRPSSSPASACRWTAVRPLAWAERAPQARSGRR